MYHNFFDGNDASNDEGTLWKVGVDVLQLYRYAGSAGVIALLSEILCALFIVIVTILEFIKMYRRRLDYFRDVWTVFIHVSEVINTPLEDSKELCGGDDNYEKGTEDFQKWSKHSVWSDISIQLKHVHSNLPRNASIVLIYFRDVWNVFQWTAIILFYIAVCVYVLRCEWTVRVIEDLMNNPGEATALSSFLWTLEFSVVMGLISV